jgi:uncharacterized membrane protein
MKIKLNLKEKKRTEADLLHDDRLLKRIQTLVDVVYGLILFELFLLLPKPTKEIIVEGKVKELFNEHGAEILTGAMGIMWVIQYWGQSNTMFGYLKRTNKTITSMAIFQLFVLMLYLYFIMVDNEIGGHVYTLILQSICLAIAGIIGIVIWRYASLNAMLFDELKQDQRHKIQLSILPEPIAAIITIPVAFLGPTWYSIVWFSVAPLGILLKRKFKPKTDVS